MSSPLTRQPENRDNLVSVDFRQVLVQNNFGVMISLAASLHLHWPARAKVNNDNNASSNLEIHLFLNGFMLNWYCGCLMRSNSY